MTLKGYPGLPSQAGGIFGGLGLHPRPTLLTKTDVYKGGAQINTMGWLAPSRYSTGRERRCDFSRLPSVWFISGQTCEAAGADALAASLAMRVWWTGLEVQAQAELHTAVGAERAAVGAEAALA